MDCEATCNGTRSAISLWRGEVPPNEQGNRRADEMRADDQGVCRRLRLTVGLGGRLAACAKRAARKRRGSRHDEVLPHRCARWWGVTGTPTRCRPKIKACAGGPVDRKVRPRIEEMKTKAVLSVQWDRVARPTRTIGAASKPRETACHRFRFL